MFIANKIGQQVKNDTTTQAMEPSNAWAVHWI
jgi:hypothetical protein